MTKAVAGILLPDHCCQLLVFSSAVLTLLYEKEDEPRSPRPRVLGLAILILNSSDGDANTALIAPAPAPASAVCGIDNSGNGLTIR